MEYHWAVHVKLEIVFASKLIPAYHFLDWAYKVDGEYKFGCLHFWNGMIPHRVGRFKLDDGEYRITFQGHFYVDPKSRIAKVYFW